jgi:hypothetical protein
VPLRTASGQFLALVFSATAFVATANAAAAEGWRIVDKVGEVSAGAAGIQKASVSRDDVLAADSWIRTGRDGRVVLARGRETIVLSPGSRVQLPDGTKNGNTQVLQNMGSAFYQIGKQQQPHFQVDAPALAAVVKGTAFTVTVDGDKSSVAVSEGLVEVVTTDGSSSEHVRPGFIATVVHGTASISVERGAAPSATPDGGPKAEKSASQVSIPATIGEVELDIKTVSNGLAYGERVDATTLAALTDGEGKNVKDKNDDNSGNGGAASSTPTVASPDLGEGVGGASNVGGNGNGSAVGQSPDLAPNLGDDGGGPGNSGSNAYGHTKPDKIKNK